MALGVYTHILWWNESDYKKPGGRWPVRVASAPGLKLYELWMSPYTYSALGMKSIVLRKE